jgi:hypothetical protein
LCFITSGHYYILKPVLIMVCILSRVLLLNSQLKPDAQAVIRAVWIEDPSDARLAQWKDVKVEFEEFC